MQPEPWVSLEDIAKHLSVSQDTIHRWIRSRGMPAHRVGRIWRFQISEVDDWVREGNAQSGREGHDSSGNNAEDPADG